MTQFHYLLTSEAEHQNGHRLLVGEAITTEDQAERKRLSVERDLRRKSSSGNRKLSEKQRECSFSKRCPGNVEDCCSASTGWFNMRSKPIPTSKFVVSSSSEETSSSGRGDEYSVMEEIVNSVKRSIEGGEPLGNGEVMWRSKVYGLGPLSSVKGRRMSTTKSYVWQSGRKIEGLMRGPWNDHLVWVEDNCMQVPDELAFELNHKFYNPTKAFIPAGQDQPVRLCYSRSRQTKIEYQAKCSVAREASSAEYLSSHWGAATTQEIAKSISGDVDEDLEVVLVEVEKSSLKRKRHEEEGSSRTKPHASAKMADLERKYYSMTATNLEHLDAEYYEHTFAFSILLKGVQKCLEQKSQEFRALTARLEVQSTRLKKFEDQFARVKEFEAELKLEKEQRAEEAKAVAELTAKYSNLVACDDVMFKSIEALKVERNYFIQSYYDFGLSPANVELSWVGRYKEIELPLEAPEEVLNQTEYERRNFKLNSEKTFKELYDLQDSERGLKEAYVVLLKERGVVPDPARVMFLAQEARNRHSLEARKYSARAGLEGYENCIFQDKERANRVHESRNSAVLDEKCRVEKQCEHLKTLLHEAQTKLSELILPKQVNTEIGSVYDRDMAAAISFFASEFQRLEKESELVHDVIAGKSVQYGMVAIRYKYLGPMVAKIGILRQGMARDGKKIITGKMPKFICQWLYGGCAPGIAGPSNIGDSSSNSSSEE
ncbi:hypothetical protein GIB67_011752 [Kingdonia uniflora]|uniref:Uncharacterized protein n=1 Tax=Kingdonia uniflora TaxID=39325 RepID=A0A7J7LUS4_9MAGN|nr:hypothetical protein GIB67_011752 [Kingdonia uniflora]